MGAGFSIVATGDQVEFKIGESPHVVFSQRVRRPIQHTD
jgi:hypothetical protein